MQRPAIVTLIILINIAVFMAWNFWTNQEFMVDHFLVSWTGLCEGRYWTLITSVFSHNLFLHLFVNMYVLSSFGTFLERVMGTWKFIKFYMVAGILSSLCHCLVSAFLLGQPDLPALGASGAIAGLVLLFSLIFPKERLLIFGLIPIPAFWGALAFVGLDLYGLFEQTKGGGLPIGHGAHLGGALTGAVYYVVFIRPKIKQQAPMA